jgi:hypothetical protein
VYNRNLKLYRSVDNRIDLQVRNSDQKAITVTGYYLVFNIITREGKDLVLSKDCNPISLGDGTLFVTVTKEELNDLDNGFYNYSIIKESRVQIAGTDEYKVTSRTPMYQDSQYGVIATLEISGDALGDAEPSLEITESNYVNPASTGYQDPAFSVFSIINAKSHIDTAKSLHTFQFYQDENYAGRITIQGSLDQSTDPVNWVDIPNAEVTPGGNGFVTEGATVTYRNVVGKYNWFRVRTGVTFNGSARFVVGNTMEGNYNVSVYDGGSSYVVGDQLVITGDRLGGGRGVNDLTIVVSSVNSQGSISGITFSGTSISESRSYVLGVTGPGPVGTVDKILYR